MKINPAKLAGAAFYTCCVSLLLAANASAYIDPATTSYIIQIVVGVVIACGTAAGIIFNKLKRKVKKKSEDENADAPVTISNDGEHGGVVTADDLLSDDEEADK